MVRATEIGTGLGILGVVAAVIYHKELIAWWNSLWQPKCPEGQVWDAATGKCVTPPPPPPPGTKPGGPLYVVVYTRNRAEWDSYSIKSGYLDLLYGGAKQLVKRVPYSSLEVITINKVYRYIFTGLAAGGPYRASYHEEAGAKMSGFPLKDIVCNKESGEVFVKNDPDLSAVDVNITSADCPSTNSSSTNGKRPLVNGW